MPCQARLFVVGSSDHRGSLNKTFLLFSPGQRSPKFRGLTMKDASTNSWFPRACLVFLLTGAVAETVHAAAPPPTMLLPRGSAWKYNNTGTDLGTAWRTPGYNDSAWGGPSLGP